MAMTTALVTGAAGLLGRATVDRLVSTGIEVHALVRPESRVRRDDVEYHEVDLSQPLDRSQLPAKVDTVFHLAQAREFRDFPQAALATFAINVGSTAWLLDWARVVGAESFVYASSGGVYRPGTPHPLVEDAALQEPAALGNYLGGKLACEGLVHSYGGEMGTSVLRYFFIYGPGQSRSMLIPRLYDRVRNGEGVQLQGHEGMRLNPVHVSDAARATVAAARLTGRTSINVAGPEVVSIREIAELFARDLGVEPRFDMAEGPASDLVASTERMKELLSPPTVVLGAAVADIRG